jgi:hypothetical protein
VTKTAAEMVQAAIDRARGRTAAVHYVGTSAGGYATYSVGSSQDTDTAYRVTVPGRAVRLHLPQRAAPGVLAPRSRARPPRQRPGPGRTGGAGLRRAAGVAAAARGDVRETTMQRTPPEVRFWRYVDKSGDCWEWTGGHTDSGYGNFKVRSCVQVLAHRFSYELHHGPIPAGLWVRRTDEAR